MLALGLSFLAGLAAPLAARAAPVLAYDAFHRTVPDGWGSAGVGSTWTVEGARFSVDGDAGAMSLAPRRRSARASLTQVRGRDVEAYAGVSMSRGTRRRAATPYLQVRQGPSGSYRFWVVARRGRFVSVGVSRVVRGHATRITSRRIVPAIPVTTGFRLRVQATGTNPTRLIARIWRRSVVEPGALSFATRDATKALQRSGSFDVGVLRPRSGRAVKVRFASIAVVAVPPAAPPAPPPPAPPPPAPDAVLVGAGDIASCTTNRDEQTAALVDALPSATVFTVGDNAYLHGSTSDYASCYAPSWGRFRARTHPAAGDDDYDTGNANAYFSYFGAAAGAPGQGWYAYDLGAWRIYVLNSQCAAVGGCGTGSPQLAWLQRDLAGNPRRCVAAIWHTPRYSSGTNGSYADTQPLWAALADAGAELVLSGHDHDYERFQPLSAAGQPDANGLRQFVVGTGGAGGGAFPRNTPGSAARSASAIGVLELTLHPASYDYRFLPIPSRPYADSGTVACH